MKKFCIIVFLLTVSFQFGYCADHIEYLTGVLEAPLQEQGDYQIIPFFLSYHYGADAFFKDQCNITIAGDLEGIVEPFINTVVNPDPNIEMGVNFLIQYIFPGEGKLRPYCKGGLGVLYMTQHTREQATQYNFLPQIGAGITVKVNESKNILIEYRFRHLSNASFQSPNKGINAHMLLVGWRVTF